MNQVTIICENKTNNIPHPFFPRVIRFFDGPDEEPMMYGSKWYEMNLIKPQKDTKSKSLSEALVNSFGGYPIGYCIGIIILPLSVGWIKEDPFTVTFLITSIYAAASFVRTYFLRRLFAKFGFDDNFIRLTIKMFQKISTKRGLFGVQVTPKEGRFWNDWILYCIISYLVRL